MLVFQFVDLLQWMFPLASIEISMEAKFTSREAMPRPGKKNERIAVCQSIHRSREYSIWPEHVTVYQVSTNESFIPLGQSTERTLGRRGESGEEKRANRGIHINYTVNIEQ